MERRTDSVASCKTIETAHVCCMANTDMRGLVRGDIIELARAHALRIRD
jgi:hypothetical protein